MNQNDSVVRDALKNWIPASMIYGSGDPLCRWMYTGTTRYCDPFFDETIARYTSLPENGKRYKSVTEAGALAGLGAQVDSVYPTAIIFHVSRCGSTLISQALAYSPENISVSEVPIFDDILRLQLKGYALSEVAIGEMLTNAVKFYGARKTAEEDRFFIKTDCWHLLFYDKLRALYPDVPFIIIYREPRAVVESNRRHRGMQSVYGLVEPALYGLDGSIPETLIHPDNYIVAVLEKLYAAIIDIAARDTNVLLLNYSEGFDTMMQRLLQFTGIKPTADELAAIAKRGQFNAKAPGVKFAEDNKGGSIHEQAALQALYERIVGDFQNLR